MYLSELVFLKRDNNLCYNIFNFRTTLNVKSIFDVNKQLEAKTFNCNIGDIYIL